MLTDDPDVRRIMEAFYNAMNDEEAMGDVAMAIGIILGEMAEQSSVSEALLEGVLDVARATIAHIETADHNLELIGVSWAPEGGEA